MKKGGKLRDRHLKMSILVVLGLGGGCGRFRNGFSEKQAEIFFDDIIRMNKYSKVYIIGEYVMKFSDEMKKLYSTHDFSFYQMEPGNLFKHNRHPDFGKNDLSTKTQQIKESQIYPLSYQIKESPFSKEINYLRRYDGVVDYVSFNEFISKNIYHLAALVKTETLNNKGFYVSNELKNISEITFEKIPDIFNGEYDLISKIQILSPNLKKDLREFILLGINHLRMFLHAGYNILENKIPVEGWVIQIGSPWISLIISLNQITPSFIDATIQKELFLNSQMRKMIFDKTLNTLANYIVFVESDIDIKDRGFKNWENINLWNYIHHELYLKPLL